MRTQQKVNERVEVRYFFFDSVFCVISIRVCLLLLGHTHNSSTTASSLGTLITYIYRLHSSICCRGERMDAYILDSLIDISPPDFEDSARRGYTGSSINETDQDFYGHGTHVAEQGKNMTLLSSVPNKNVA